MIKWNQELTLVVVYRAPIRGHGECPMPHYGVRRSVLVNLDLEVRVCFQQSLLHCPREPSADSLIPSNQSTTFIQTFISCHLDPLSATNLCYARFPYISFLLCSSKPLDHLHYISKRIQLQLIMNQKLYLPL